VISTDNLALEAQSHTSSPGFAPSDEPLSCSARTGRPTGCPPLAVDSEAAFVLAAVWRGARVTRVGVADHEERLHLAAAVATHLALRTPRAVEVLSASRGDLVQLAWMLDETLGPANVGLPIATKRPTPPGIGPRPDWPGRGVLLRTATRLNGGSNSRLVIDVRAHGQEDQRREQLSWWTDHPAAQLVDLTRNPDERFSFGRSPGPGSPVPLEVVVAGGST